MCGAKSCPPIKVYTSGALEEGLEAAASAFCEGELHLLLLMQEYVTVLPEAVRSLRDCFSALQPGPLRCSIHFNILTTQIQCSNQSNQPSAPFSC